MKPTSFVGGVLRIHRILAAGDFRPLHPDNVRWLVHDAFDDVWLLLGTLLIFAKAFMEAASENVSAQSCFSGSTETTCNRINDQNRANQSDPSNPDKPISFTNRYT